MNTAATLCDHDHDESMGSGELTYEQLMDFTEPFDGLVVSEDALRDIIIELDRQDTGEWSPHVRSVSEQQNVEMGVSEPGTGAVPTLEEERKEPAADSDTHMVGGVAVKLTKLCPACNQQRSAKGFGCHLQSHLRRKDRCRICGGEHGGERWLFAGLVLLLTRRRTTRLRSVLSTSGTRFHRHMGEVSSGWYPTCMPKPHDGSTGPRAYEAAARHWRPLGTTHAALEP